MLLEQRTQFIRYLVALIVYIGDGRGNIGFLRWDPEGPIHRDYRTTTEDRNGREGKRLELVE